MLNNIKTVNPPGKGACAPGVRRKRLVGGYVPDALFEGVAAWVAQGPKRDLSQFVREAMGAKLAGEGIAVGESGAPVVEAPGASGVPAAGTEGKQDGGEMAGS